MADHDLNALARTARRQRRLPPGAACDECGTTQHLHLLSDGRLLCYADRQTERGASSTELDHPAGRHNVGGLIIRLRANDHRTVTEYRTALGIDEWPAAEGDPLLVLAHFLGGLGALLVLLAEWLVGAARHVADRLGPDWWSDARPAPMVP